MTSPEGETTLLFPDDFGLARRLTPLPASSGKTTGRHRLNRGGNRQANNALWRIVIGRLRWHHPTRDYVARRTVEGSPRRRSSAASSATSHVRPSESSSPSANLPGLLDKP